MKKSDLQRMENCLSFRGEEKYVLAQVIHQCDIFGYPQICCIKFCHHCCTVNVFYTRRKTKVVIEPSLILIKTRDQIEEVSLLP